MHRMIELMSRGLRGALLSAVALSASAVAGAQGNGAAAAPNLAGKILTVTGPIDPAQAGATLMHEHIFIDFKAPATADGKPVPPTPGDTARSGGLTDFDIQLAEIRKFKDAGGGTIVDVTNFGLSRNPDWLRRVSQASGLHVVMGAGWYMRPYHPKDMNERTVEELTAILLRDITQGAQGTNVRSGIIGEVGVGAFGARIPLTENEQKSIRASARASRLTGAPISFHSFASQDEMLRALDIVASEGVDLNHVVMGHTGTGDLAAMKRYTDRGAYVEFDYIGSVRSADSSAVQLARGAERLAASIKTLIDGGLTERILVAHDVCTQAQLTKNGGGGFAYISTMVVPALRKLGVTDETIHKILVENPRRVLTFVAPQPQVKQAGA
ncbi:MAG: TatD family hydrolase [Gemmatimonadaceae bacterium]|nr:TatD family hydrolase [Gemmatimonadaceae bacterium]